MSNMSPQDWQAEFTRRIMISEGTRLYKYKDSRGVVTLGTGYNFERSDARQAIEQCGGDWNMVAAGPVAIDSLPQNAVAEVITNAVALSLLNYSLKPIVSEARASLAEGIFDSMTDARRFVICDLVYNMGAGEEGWGGFPNTIALINQAQAAKNSGAASAHDLFVAAADHLEESAWFTQVGERAGRDVAMLREGVWASATGDGSDI